MTIAIFVSLGAAVMLMCIFNTRRIMRLVRSDKYFGQWRVLWFLMMFFFVGYLGVLALLFLEVTQALLTLTGLVFFFGALFVYLVVQVGRLTIVDLKNEMTERRRADAGRRDMQAQLHHAQKMESLGTLAGGIAHDFNNLLTPILGLTTLLREEVGPDTDHGRKLQRVSDAAETARELVSRILIFGRKSAIVRHRIQPEKALQDALQFLQAVLPSTIAVDCQTAADVPDIEADSGQIHQVLTNLLINAAHAMPDGGKISIQLSKVDPYQFPCPEKGMIGGAFLCISVRDTGAGMDAALRDKIFDPFFTTKPRDQGTGLGLAVVMGIVREHGGNIEVDSNPGEGTEFRIYFPVATEALDADEVTGFEASMPTAGRVLFVDDEPMVNEAGEEMLTAMGFEVQAHTDPSEALAQFSANPGDFDFVISDYTMPKLTGLQLALEMRARRPALPIILCTGYAHSLTQDELEAAGVSCILPKPFDQNTLRESIAQLLIE